MDDVPSSNSPLRDLQSFNLGVLANQISWHFDQAAYTGRLRHLAEFRGLAIQIDALARELLGTSADTHVSKFLREWEGYLHYNLEVKPLDFHEFLQGHLEHASNDRGEQPMATVYYQSVFAFLPNFKQLLQEAIFNGDHFNVRDRQLFDAGKVIDAGQHSPKLAMHLACMSNEPVRHISEYSGTSEMFSVESLQHHRTKSEPGFEYFGPGEPSPYPGWEHEVRSAYMIIGIPIAPQFPAKNSDSVGIAFAVKRMLENVRSNLLPNGTEQNLGPTKSPTILAVKDGTALRESIAETDKPDQVISNQVTLHSTNANVHAELSRENNLAGNPTLPGCVVSTSDLQSAGAEIYGPQKPAKPDKLNNGTIPPLEDDCETYGSWTFSPAHVEYSGCKPFKIVGISRRILLCLARKTTNNGWVQWNFVEQQAWGENSDAGPKGVIGAIHKLNRSLKKNLGTKLKTFNINANPIESTGHADDLSYRLADQLRSEPKAAPSDR